MERQIPGGQLPEHLIAPRPTEPTALRAQRLRRRRTWGRRAAGVSAGTGVLLALSLLALAPFALGSNLGVTLKHPYSGTDDHGTFTSSGPGVCTGSLNAVTGPPTFDLKNGRGSMDITSAAVPCTSYVAEFAGVTAWFGLNSSTFTPAANAMNDHIKVRWTLDYEISLAMSYNVTANSSAYAYAGVQLDAWLFDLTTGTSATVTSVYQNYSYMSDSLATSIVFFVGPKAVVLVIVADLTAGNTYEIQTVLTGQTGALVNGAAAGPNGLPPGSSASAALSFPGTRAGTGTSLNSISY
jgi:hypothetical protein